MLEHGAGQQFNVVGDDIVSSVYGGQGLGGAEEHHGGAGAGTQGEVRVVAGPVDDAEEVFAGFLVNEDFADALLHAEDGTAVGHGAHDIDGMAKPCSFKDFGFGHNTGVADGEAHHEAIELCFGKRKGALVFDGVLGGEDGEGWLEFVGLAVDGDLSFGHGLEECGLCARGRTVDFVGDEYLGEDGAGPKLEFLVFLVKDGDAGYICGQEVWGALDALKGAAGPNGEGAYEHGLGDAGHVFEEDMAPGEKGRKGGPHDVGLVEDNGFGVTYKLLDDVAEFSHGTILSGCGVGHDRQA